MSLGFISGLVKYSKEHLLFSKYMFIYILKPLLWLKAHCKVETYNIEFQKNYRFRISYMKLYVDVAYDRKLIIDDYL